VERLKLKDMRESGRLISLFHYNNTAILQKAKILARYNSSGCGQKLDSACVL
jgi:hypothetical protein